MRDLSDFISKQHPLVKGIFKKNSKTLDRLFGEALSENEVPWTLFSWENLTKLLNLEEEIPEGLIKGLFGRLTPYLKEALGNRVRVLDSRTDEFMRCLDKSIRAGVPLGMFGITGMGKTQRIRDYASLNGYTLHTLELSQMSSSDVMGKPEIVHVDLGELGDRVVVRAPQSKMIGIRESVGMERIILNFDEVNRLSRGSEALLSLVSQAITSRIVGGVRLPDDCAIVCTGNLSGSAYAVDEVFGERRDYDAVSSLDEGIRARLAYMVKTEYSLADVVSYRRYIKSCGLHKRLEGFLDSLTDVELLSLIKSSEYKSMENNVFDFRALKMLDLLMKEHPVLAFEGKWCFLEGMQEDYPRLLKSLEGVGVHWVGELQCPGLVSRIEWLLHRGDMTREDSDELERR